MQIDQASPALLDVNRQVVVNGVKLNVITRGSGRPIVLLHGFGASVDTWRNFTASDFPGYQFIAVDLKGFGSSDKPQDEKYSMRDQATLILEFLRQMNLHGAVLIGHSFGGGVALITSIELQKQGSDLVSKVLLIDPACYPQELPDFIQALRIPVLGSAATTILPKRFLVRQVLNRVFFDRTKISADIVDAYALPLYSEGAGAALVATAHSIIPDDIGEIIESLRLLTLPVYIYWGEEDRIIKKTSIDSLLSIIPGSTLTTIPSCGHAPQEECPGELIHLIQDVLQKR